MLMGGCMGGTWEVHGGCMGVSSGAYGVHPYGRCMGVSSGACLVERVKRNEWPLPSHIQPSGSKKKKEKNKKITAQSIPMWSPTIVLTLPSSV